MRFLASLLLLAAALPARLPAQQASPLRFDISWPAAADGHVVLILSTNNRREPRFQISEGLDTQQMFGADVENARTASIGDATLGYPLASLAEVPAGEYYVQAVLNLYETFHRYDGRTVKLPMDQGEGQHWDRKPGNLYSEPAKIKIDPASPAAIHIELTKTIPPIDPPQDTRYIKHVRIESKLLSAFWGRPMYVGAVVLLPEGFDEHPNAHYPVLYYQGHFAATISNFRTEPPGGNPNSPAQFAYKFYQDWSSGRLPHMLIVYTQDANPFYDDSYAVNSANLGPYGDALTQELYPYVEKQFRGIGQGWARAVYGGSTGGWRTLALQVLYPDFYNGAWVFCPDPIDFHAYSLVDLYDDKNGFYAASQWKKVPIPMEREPDGKVLSVMEDAIRFELVLGTKGRSAEQFDIWQAVYSPVGADGYPAPILDPRTGTIDHQVAGYWKQHYDLVNILQRDWKTLGPKLVGKLHFAVGTGDNYYLNLAVKRAEKFLESTKEPGKGPYYGGSFDYGPGMPHGYTGDPTLPMSVSSRTVNQRLMPVMMEFMLKVAPEGADVKSWRY
ncbi:MAG: alpha/beta hydrolase-fold protein [Bryobacteraceae bacterium]